MIVAELHERDREGKAIDYVAYNHPRGAAREVRGRAPRSDHRLRQADRRHRRRRLGGARVLRLALLLTALAVCWYCHSVRFTLLPILCSADLAGVAVRHPALLGYGSTARGAGALPGVRHRRLHGVQQINFIVRELSHGKSSDEAARASFTGLLIPGTLALVTAFVSFITLVLIPIPMVRELAITASLGVGLQDRHQPGDAAAGGLAVSPSPSFVCRQGGAQAREALGLVAHAGARGRAAQRGDVVALTLAVFAVAVAEPRPRHRHRAAGRAELRADSRFNRDAVSIAGSYDTGLDWLTVIFEAPPGRLRRRRGGLPDRLVAEMQSNTGACCRRCPSLASCAPPTGATTRATRRCRWCPPTPQLRRARVRRDPGGARLYNKDCSMTAVNLFLADRPQGDTINRVVDAVKAFRESDREPGRRSAWPGQRRVQAATNEGGAFPELPMMLYVYAAIHLVLVALMYRDLRAVIACCLPLTVGTFIGYWFMKARRSASPWRPCR